MSGIRGQAVSEPQTSALIYSPTDLANQRRAMLARIAALAGATSRSGARIPSWSLRLERRFESGWLGITDYAGDAVAYVKRSPGAIYRLRIHKDLRAALTSRYGVEWTELN